MATGRAMRLRVLLDALGPEATLHAPARPDQVGVDPASLRIGGVAYDSRQVEPGWLFCCVPGARTDGHRFAGEAAQRGAVALLVQHRLTSSAAANLVQIEVPDTRRAMATVAETFWGHPSTQLMMVGVTGTNGKDRKSVV